MSDADKIKNITKNSWNDFVKVVANFSKLFHSTEPKTMFLCPDLTYSEVCTLVAERIISSLFLGKDKFFQEEEDGEFNFIEKKGFYIYYFNY